MACCPPRVSVLMTTFNGAAYLRESIDSVLAQDFTDFEFIIVDDGSTDATPAILATYNDPRLRILRTPRNLGVVGARNFGFATARGTYLAALDHDDVSTPARLGTQCAYLDAHPQVVLAASEIRVIEDGRLRTEHHARGGDPVLMRWMLHVDNPLTWSSVMVRLEAIRRLGAFMDAEFQYSDDFDLYHRLLALGDIARLETPLTHFRLHGASASHIARGALIESAARIFERAYKPWFGEDAARAGALAARHFSGRRRPPDLAALRAAGDVLERVLAGFCQAHPLDPAARRAIESHAGCLWWRLARATLRAGSPAALRDYRGHPALLGEWRAGPRDIAQSLLIGALRRPRLTRALLSWMRG